MVFSSNSGRGVSTIFLLDWLILETDRERGRKRERRGGKEGGRDGGRKEEGKGEGERDWSGNLLAVFKNSLVYALIRIISEICNITLSA